MEDRTKWHREMNKGFVPILEVPPQNESEESRIILESANIMNYLETLTGDEFFCEGPMAYQIPFKGLYSPDPEIFEKQQEVMKMAD